jgi:uncharacterized SAM-binding protein YcdF (DUF218 family)
MTFVTTLRGAIRVALPLVGMVVVFLVILAADIVHYSHAESTQSAQAGVVLGAAAWGANPSPVYRERINHAIDLYRQGRIRKLIFTGGTRFPDFPTEAKVAHDYAIHHGIAEKDILIEPHSRTTYENLSEVKKLTSSMEIESILIISDPLHMKRAMYIAEELGLQAEPSPTEFSKFQSFPIQVKFLFHETWALARQMIHSLGAWVMPVPA